MSALQQIDQHTATHLTFQYCTDFLLQILERTLLNNSFQVFQLPFAGKFFPDNATWFHGTLDRIDTQKADSPQDERQHSN